MNQRLRSWVLVVAVGGMACGGGGEVTTIRQAVTMPAQVQSSVSCAPSGTSVTITGGLELAGLGAQVVMRNNEKGTHERTDDLGASLVLIPADARLEIPTATAQGAPVEDPIVSIQLLDADGVPVAGEIVLGSCIEGSLTVDAAALLPAIVELHVGVAGCANQPGPTVTVEGAVTFSGLQQRLVVRDGSGGAVAGQVVLDAEIVALRPGETLSVPKQPSRGGVGGNPWIWVRLHDGAGASLSEEILVGRCVQLAGGAD